MVGPTTIENSEPNLIIHDDVEPSNKSLLERLKEGILEKPELYSAVLDIAVDYVNENVESGIAKEIEYLHEHEDDADQVPVVKDLWTLYLRGLPGGKSIASDYSFDPATDAEIRKDSDIQDLLAESRDSRTPASRKPEISDQLKLARMKFFVGRVATYYSLSVESTNQEADEANIAS